MASGRILTTSFPAAVPLLIVLSACAGAPASAPSPSVDDYFQTFTDEWVRQNPDLAVRAQYFEGEEQDRLSRRLTPVTRESQLGMIERAQDGLQQLATFDRETMTPSQRVSAEILRWQLQNLVEGEPYLDYDFPLQQMNGVNVNLPNELAVVHPVRPSAFEISHPSARWTSGCARARRRAADWRTPASCPRGSFSTPRLRRWSCSSAPRPRTIRS